MVLANLGLNDRCSGDWLRMVCREGIERDSPRQEDHRKFHYLAWRPGNIAPLGALAILIVSYLFLTLKWEDFANYDDAYFTLFTLQGQNLSPPIWRENGRFFPLCHQEFNLIRRFTSSVAGYHVLPLFQLVILVGILLVLDDELSERARAVLAACVLILPGIVICFTGLVFPERNVVFWLVWLVFFIAQFERTVSTAWAVAAITSAQIMIYYKETVFLLVLAFASTRLILRCRVGNSAKWDWTRLEDKKSRLDLCLLAISALFVLYYIIVMIPHVNMRYANEQRISLGNAIVYYLKLDLLAWLLVGFTFTRAFKIIRRGDTPALLWDGFAAGAVVYFLAYLYLRLPSVYYLTPVDMIAVLYLGRFAALSWTGLKVWRRTATWTLATILLLQSQVVTAFRVFERKNVVHAKTQIASLLGERYHSSENGIRLFFPFATNYQVTEFASYLSYRGMAVEGMSAPTPHKFVTLIVRTSTKDSRCVYYRNFVCRAATTPEPGDLVVELPDDDASRAEVGRFQRTGVPLFMDVSHPSVPSWMNPILSRLRFVSPMFEYRELPDRWLDASVTLCK